MSSRPARRIGITAVVSGLLGLALTAAPQAVAGGTAHGTARGTAHAAPASATQLAAADAAVRRADVTGTAWYTDPARGRLVVTADSTVSRAEIERIKDAVHAPGALQIRRTPGRLAERVAGGDPITTPGGLRCTVGFNVQDTSGIKYALTAGHCTSAAGTWSIGQVAASSFPGNDYGLIRYTDQSQAEGGVRGPDGGLIDIVDAGTPPVGDQVCTVHGTDTRCGRVIALNATVNYGDGIVYGLIQTNICSEPGDSGGPLYSGHTALGITSGGSGNCSSGGVTFFQPVLEPLQAYNLTVF